MEVKARMHSAMHFFHNDVLGRLENILLRTHMESNVTLLGSYLPCTFYVSYLKDIQDKVWGSVL